MKEQLLTTAITGVVLALLIVSAARYYGVVCYP